MRKIKFRAWHKDKMMYDIELSSGLYNDGRYGYGEGDIHKDTPVMQYTGLKDKNDVEIYGGDILQMTERFSYPAEDKIKLGHVEFKQYGDSEAYYDYEHLGWTFCYYEDNHRTLPDVCGFSEVIGNIYESPELLDNK